MAVNRIVVTGMGAVTSVGNDVATFWDSLVGAHSGIAPITSFPTGDAPPIYAGEVKGLSAERTGLPRRKLKVMGRPAQLAFAAAHEACADAGIGLQERPAETRLGIILGVGMLNADVMELGRAFHATAAALAGESFDEVAFGRSGAPQLFPLWLLRHIPNLAAAHTSIAFDAQGPSNTITTGCVGGANAIGEAARILARGDADVMLAGGADARVCPLSLLRYRDIGWLATRDDLPGPSVSAPFDAGATGFVTAEAGAILVLESLQHAQRRGARIRAELAGYGGGNDAYDLLQPHPAGRGLARAMRRCLATGGLAPAQVDVVFAPALSIPAFDHAGGMALQHTFGTAPGRPLVTATRSLLGHAHAASAAVDCIAAIKAIEDSVVPPIANLQQPTVDLAFVSTTARPVALSTAMVAAYGFGGNAAALAWRGFAN